MYYLMIGVFIFGYASIALEHTLKIDKAASAIFTAVTLWTLLVIGANDLQLPFNDNLSDFIDTELMHHLGEISGILFFLLGAMTIVEIVDVHGGFELVTSKISTTKKTKLLWIMSFITFFMSAALDNLTTAIIMAALLRKLLKEKEDLWMFAGMIIIAANAGGAWSPIGDVTTIMLWIGEQVTATNIILKLFLPSLICMLIPLLLMSRKLKGQLPVVTDQDKQDAQISEQNKKLVLYLGLGALLFVPIFKTLTHLPPFLGVLLGLSILWITTELMHKKKADNIRKTYSIAGVLRKIDTPSILFFLGILLAVSAIQVAGHLTDLALILDKTIGNIWIVNTLIGVFSSIVDNVPLVAGAIGMYDFNTYPQDHIFWELLAYCAGTGGSILIIGSAAGVAIMGALKINFMWFVKNISLYAIIGYVSGILTFYALVSLIH